MTDEQLSKLLKELKRQGVQIVGPVRFELAYQEEVDKFIRRVEDVFKRSRNAPPMRFDAAFS